MCTYRERAQGLSVVCFQVPLFPHTLACIASADVNLVDFGWQQHAHSVAFVFISARIHRESRANVRMRLTNSAPACRLMHEKRALDELLVVRLLRLKLTHVGDAFSVRFYLD